MKRKELTRYLDEFLHLPDFASDVSNNGLQLEGRGEVNKIVGGVDACLALAEKAAERGADMIFVHHGMSWGDEPRCFTGVIGREMSFLFRHDISLYGCHLPLDAHPECGNNIILSRMAGLENVRFTMHYHGCDIGITGELPEPVSALELWKKMGGMLNARGVLHGDPDKTVRRVTAVSGGGGMEALKDAGLQNSQMLITGEMTHTMYHPALEANIAVAAFGHYVTETIGVRAVLAHLKEKFGLETEFIDLPTGY